jgi:hypothetical protein
LSDGFTTVYGRNLVGELPDFVHRPYLVVTMADLWPAFAATLEGPGLGGVHQVQTLDVVELDATLGALPTVSSVIGLGGGQAIDVAKFIAWRRRLPLFQVPTAMTVNAPFGHRSGLRRDGVVRYLGYAIPEAVYVDFDVIRTAPIGLNRAGVDIRPEAMGVTWEDADAAMRTLGTFVREAGLWHSIADERPVDDAIVTEVRERVTAAYGPWQATS